MRKPPLKKVLHSPKGEHGQILILVAVAFIGMLAIIGLAVDAGTLFVGLGHLRRAVDSAALAAAAQYREGRTLPELTSAADEFFALNEGNLLITTVTVETCNTTPNLCPGLKRKFVRVTAQADVRFNFLPIVGFNTLRISANAVSEAASLDVVLVIDTSDSMAYGTPCSTGDNACIQTCNANHSCEPFEHVKTAAITFINDLYTPYDRVGIVTFSQQSGIALQLQTDKNTAKNTVNNLQVSLGLTPGTPPCTWTTLGDDPSGCTNTSIGGGLRAAAAAFSNPAGGPSAIRDESLWVVILLTDGAANASVPNQNGSVINIYCPQSTWQQPFCRDGSATTRHSRLSGTKNNPNNVYRPNRYDADDFARDMADLVGCPSEDPGAASWCHDSLTYAVNEGGQNALIFTIGLGPNMINNPFGDPEAGEKLLRYAANVGDDGDPSPTNDPCIGVPSAKNCGNYYYSPTSSELVGIFEDIASRIFTRLTK